MEKILTIVIPSYNVEKYIHNTLYSILQAQNVDKMDIIIVNDGSTDNTEKIVLESIEDDTDNTRLINKDNGGHGSAINSGLAVAEGKYFIVIDGDDWIETKKIDEFITFLEKCSQDVVVTGHYRNYIKTNCEEKYGYKERRGFECNVEYLLEKNYLIPMTDICYKTELLKNVNLSIQENTFYVDEEFCCIPFVKVNSIIFWGDGFYHYRIGDESQSMSDTNMVNRIDHKMRVLTNLTAILSISEIPSANKEYIKRRLVMIALSILLVFYIYFPDKKTGRILGKNFYRNLYENNYEIACECRTRYMIFYIMNFLHFNGKGWAFYKKIKYLIVKK